MALPFRNWHKNIRQNWRGVDLLLRFIQEGGAFGGSTPGTNQYILTRASEPITTRVAGERWVWR